MQLTQKEITSNQEVNSSYQCDLCSQELTNSIIEGEKGLRFCCLGCRAVYQVLSAKSQLDQVQEHPLYQHAVKEKIISNRNFEELHADNPEDIVEERQAFLCEIHNMWCPSCAELIRLASKTQKGIVSCSVDYTTDLARIEYAPRKIGKEAIISFIRSLGYDLSSIEHIGSEAEPFISRWRATIAGFLAINIMMLSYPVYAALFNIEKQGFSSIFGGLSFFLAVPIVTYCSWPIFCRAYHGLRYGLLGMELLASISILSSFGFSTYELVFGNSHIYFDSLALIVWLILAGKTVEGKTKAQAKLGLHVLFRNMPKRARKQYSDGTCQFVPIKEIDVGDIIEVYAGERIVLDGIVYKGYSLIDESALTGESLPKEKQINDKVYSGTLVQNGVLSIKVTAKEDKTFYHHILASLWDSHNENKKEEYSLDKLLRWFIPTIIGLTILVALVCLTMQITDTGFSPMETAWRRAMCILLISCPCAIGIAVPIVESTLVSNLSQQGILVRDRSCLSKLANITHYIFDKTGTLTEGKFRVLSGIEHLTSMEKSILKGLAAKSRHPISVAIYRYLKEEPICLDKVQEYAGKGILGAFKEDVYFLGSGQFIKEMTLSEMKELYCPIDFEQSAISTVYFATQSRVISCLVLGDQIRDEAKSVVKELGVDAKTILLSGDRKDSVRAVAQLIGIQDYLSQLSPWEKKEYVETLVKSNHLVCMIGDGINDAPALASASVGISLRSGTDLSIQASDLCLMKDQLSELSYIKKIGKKSHKIIQQNLFWAFSYNFVGIFLAVFGKLNPVFSAFAMVISSCIVIVNAIRLSSLGNKDKAAF